MQTSKEAATPQMQKEKCKSPYRVIYTTYNKHKNHININQYECEKKQKENE